MLEYERASLRRVTLETGFVLAQQRNAAAFERLGQTSAATFDG